jgi:hypothetical protein
MCLQQRCPSRLQREDPNLKQGCSENPGLKHGASYIMILGRRVPAKFDHPKSLACLQHYLRPDLRGPTMSTKSSDSGKIRKVGKRPAKPIIACKGEVRESDVCPTIIVKIIALSEGVSNTSVGGGA